MSKKITDLYRSMITTADWVADDLGMISEVIGGEKSQVRVEGGRRLVLPIPEQLAVPDWSERRAFNPLNENVVRVGKSAVLERFRLGINARFNRVIGLLAYRLLVIAASASEHPKLSPDQHEFLSFVKNADDSTIEILKKLMAPMSRNQTQKQFVNIFLKNGGSLGGQKHGRVAVVNFPLYEELKSTTNNTVWGVKINSKKNTATLIALLEYIFPKIGEKDAYSRASDSTQAPFTDCLMKAVIALAAPINQVVDLFANQLDNLDDFRYNDAWVPAFTNIDSLHLDIKMIPMLPGNEGESDIPLTQAPAPAPQPAAVQAPAPAPAQPGVWQPPGYQQPTGYAQQAWNSQPAQPLAPPPAASGNPNDFQTHVANNPALRAIFGPGPVMAPGNVSYRDAPPRWAPGGGTGGGGGGWAAQASGWANQQGGGWGQQQQPGWGNQQRGGWGQPSGPQSAPRNVNI